MFIWIIGKSGAGKSFYAKKLLNKLKSEGFDASFAKNSPSGLFRVAYGRLKTKREAYQLLNFVKFTLELDAWYLVE